MPVESSANHTVASDPAFAISAGTRLGMILLGYIPLFHFALTAIATFVTIAFTSTWGGLATAVVVIYLVPPLAARLVRPRSTLTEVHYPMGTAGFLRWWYTAQCQVVFNRLPLLEEVLRLMPGAYSMWMRLWGARIGTLVYWSPNVVVYDRGFLDIGNRVVIGAGTKICPHYLARSPSGEMELVLAPVSIGHDALIGGFSLLPAGVRVDPCEQTPGYRPMAPFARFHDGKHTRTVRHN